MKHQLQYADLTTTEAQEVREVVKKKEEQLGDYLERLMWWNKKINLVSRDVSRETIASHIEHSLCVRLAKEYQEGAYIIDAGTGGGLPGIPLGIADPKKKMVLNDIVTKKIMACKHISKGLGLKNIQAISGSIERIEKPDGAVVISKHAFKINDLVKMLGQSNWASVLLLKGGEEVENELSGIDTPLSVLVKRLENGFEDSFYNGKALVQIKKI